MVVEITTNYDYLIDYLRLQLGDTDPTAYRYLDSWLRTALEMAIKTLQPWWDFRYLIDNSHNVTRDINYNFEFTSPPIIQHYDERPIVLMASIIIKKGSLEQNSWVAGSWKDAEISYSNIEGSQSKKESLRQDIDELYSLIKPPKNKLARTKKGSLPGYLDNIFENKD